LQLEPDQGSSSRRLAVLHSILENEVKRDNLIMKSDFLQYIFQYKTLYQVRRLTSNS